MTIRSTDPELERAIEEMSRKRRWSTNQVAVHLMRKGLGLTTDVEPILIGDRLDGFWGKWSAKEARQFDSAVEDAFENVDEENWR